MYATHLQDSKNLFDQYERRGDREHGAMSDWFAAKTALDQQLSRVSAPPAFTELFFLLRNHQADYLISENANQGNQMQDLYDEMQEFLLFSPEWEVSLDDRITTQERLQEEAVAFSEVREAMRGLIILHFTLEGTSTVLEQYIDEFRAQAHNDILAKDDDTLAASRKLYRLFVIGGLGGSLVLGLGLALAHLRKTPPE
jgi:hypothetical protein